MKQLDSDYVARYEYACSLIAKFMERELSINPENDALFTENGSPQILFTADYSKLTLPSVRKAIATNITRLRNDQAYTIMNRLHSVVVDFYAILGKSFVDELITNTTHGIAAVGGDSSKQTVNEILKFMNQYIELLVFIMGSKIYQHEFIIRKITKKALTPEMIQ